MVEFWSVSEPSWARKRLPKLGENETNLQEKFEHVVFVVWVAFLDLFGCVLEPKKVHLGAFSRLSGLLLDPWAAQKHGQLHQDRFGVVCERRFESDQVR